VTRPPSADPEAGMSAHGRSEALILEREARKVVPMSPPGRPKGESLERAARRVVQ